MAGEFILKRLFFWKNTYIGMLKTRWEVKDYIKDVKHIKEDMDNSDKITLQHDLSKIEDLNTHLKKNGDDAVKEYFALVTNDFLWLDSILRNIPDAKAAEHVLDTLKEKFKGNKEIEKAITEAKKKISNKRAELLKQGEEDLKKEYKTFLNLMAAVRTKDTATLMNDMKQIFSTGGTQYLSYMALRYDVKDEIRDYRKSTTHRNKAAGALKELRAIGLGKETVTQKDIEKILSKWNEATNAIYEDVKDAFENGMKALIRSTSTMLTLVIYLHKIYKEEEKYASAHEIPLAMAEDMEKAILELFHTLDGEVHELVEGEHKVKKDLEKELEWNLAA